MEVNNHFGPHMPHKDMPTPEQLMYLHSMPVGVNISEADLQAQLMGIEKYYRIQEESLVQQFESQRRMLETEHQVKMEEQIKLLMLQKQQQQMYEHQKKLQEQRLQQERMEKEKLEMIKHKNKDEESAVASSEVKQKLRECLLNKGQRDPGILKNSPPDYRQWATHHSSLEQHSPPTINGRSPPLRAAHMLGRFEDQYPLRKTVSEPNLKMRSRIMLRQKVMMHRSPLVTRRDLARKMMISASSEPNLKVRLALKQKMIERRSTTLLRRKERFTLNAKRTTTPLTIETNSPDSSPSSPHSGSQGSQGSVGGELHTPQKEGPEGTTAFPLQMMSKMIINQSMPNISIGQPRDNASAAEASVVTNLSANMSEAELRARAAAEHGLPLTQHMLSGTIPMYPSLLEMSPTNPAYIDAQMKAMELARTTGQIPLSPTGMPPGHGFRFGITDAQAAKARLHRQTLNRTQSAPLPLPGQLMWNQHLMQQQELILKETQKLHLKHRLQTALLQKSASKGHMMENVDEKAETKLVLEMKAIKEKEDEDVVIVCDPDLSTSHEAFLRKLKQQTGGATMRGAPHADGSIPGRTLERAMSSPLVTAGHHMPSLIAHETPTDGTFLTGLAYDSLMLKHQCMCGNNANHPEHPGRLQSVYARLLETGLLNKCEKLQCHKASLEELQTCHSEAYTLMYGTSPQKLSPKLFEVLQPRFCKLPCGGIGVDSDTVWNDAQTPQATRMAVGCAIELATNIASGRLQNGLALVRPPGHHAEPTQPMGFCYFNSLAVATKVLLDRHKLKKILVVDWDVHHGNSTQQIFYADPRVLFISVHRHDNGNFFPGTGAPEECGIDKGLGYNVNVGFCGALDPPMGDAEYVAAFRTIVMPIAREFDPEIVLISAGFDAASGHPPPLGGYRVSPACFGHMTKQMMLLANGKVGMALEGGYDLQAICDSTEMCLRALLGEEIPLLTDDEMCRPPSRVAVDALEQTIRNHVTYWPCLARYRDTLSWSIVEAQQREREEVDTVNAFASLSVVPGKSPEMISRQLDYATAEAMEES